MTHTRIHLLVLFLPIYSLNPPSEPTLSTSLLKPTLSTPPLYPPYQPLLSIHPLNPLNPPLTPPPPLNQGTYTPGAAGDTVN